LIAYLCGSDKLEQVWTKIVAEEEQAFSEVYCVFQEERHTALTPEERDVFNPLYIRQEVMAVTRLLTHAKSLIKGGNHAEALKYVEATQLADLRLRQAYDMKIECLRALGRNREADVLAREKFLAWPQMSAVRRAFRFLGMVANEARRVVAARSANKTAQKKLMPPL